MKPWLEVSIVVLLLLICLALSAAYLLRPIEHFDADEAIVGLMALHIAEGHLPAYYYGQGYMGSLEAFLAAGWFLLFGASVLTLKLAPLTAYLVFLILQYCLIRRYSSRTAALLTLAITVFFSPTATLWSVKARGGFTLTLMWGTLAYLLFFRLMDGYLARRRSQAGTLGLLGLVTGLAFWTYPLAAYYYFPIVLYLLVFSIGDLRLLFRGEAGPKASDREAGKPAEKILGFFLIPALLYSLFGILTLIRGEIDLTVLGIRITSHHGGRDLIRALILIAILQTLRIRIRSGWKGLTAAVKKFYGLNPHLITGAVLIAGYLLVTGAARSHFRGLEDYSYGHDYKSFAPADRLKTVQANIYLLGVQLLPKEMGLRKTPIRLNPGRTPIARLCGRAIFFLPAAGALLLLGSLIFSLVKRSDRITPENFIRRRRLPLFFLLSVFFAFFLLIFGRMIEDFGSYRYLVPLVSWLPYFAAAPALLVEKKSKPAGLLLGGAILLCYLIKFDPFRLPPEPTAGEPLARITECLREEGIERGYADYWISYPVTFISGEEIILAPYLSVNRYPPYVRTVEESPEAAYVFFGYRNRPGRRLYEKLRAEEIPFEKKLFPWGYLLILPPRENAKRVP